MARKRVIDPSFFTDGELWENLSDWGLLFYIGLWTEAEDSGCFQGHAGTLKNRILPGRADVSAKAVQAVLDTLKDMGKVNPYKAGTKTNYWLVNFQKHQRIDYPTPPKLVLPDFIIWHGETELCSGTKGEAGYSPNRRKWHYEVM